MKTVTDVNLNEIDSRKESMRGESKRSFLRVPLLFLLLTLISSLIFPAKAEVVFSNFGPGNSYDSSSPYAVGGPSSIQHQSVAGSFTPMADFTLDSVEVPVEWLIPAQLGEVQVDVMSDNAGMPGASVDSSFLYISPLTGILQFQWFNDAQLRHGTKYWIGLSINDDAFLGWFKNTQSMLGAAFKQNNNAWFYQGGSTMPTFRVNGTLIPTPRVFSTKIASGLVSMGVSNMVTGTTNYLLRGSAIDSSGWTTVLTFKATSPLTNMIQPVSGSHSFYKMKYDLP